MASSVWDRSGPITPFLLKSVRRRPNAGSVGYHGTNGRRPL